MWTIPLSVPIPPIFDSSYLINRNITMTNENDDIYSDDAVIDQLYSLNRFYRGSVDLVVKPLAERSLLVATALLEID